MTITANRRPSFIVFDFEAGAKVAGQKFYYLTSRPPG